MATSLAVESPSPTTVCLVSWVQSLTNGASWLDPTTSGVEVGSPSSVQPRMNLWEPPARCGWVANTSSVDTGLTDESAQRVPSSRSAAWIWLRSTSEESVHDEVHATTTLLSALVATCACCASWSGFDTDCGEDHVPPAGRSATYTRLLPSSPCCTHATVTRPSGE